MFVNNNFANTGYDKIVFISKANMKKIKMLYSKIDENKLVVINNYIDKNNVIKKATENLDMNFDKNSIKFVTVARLVEAKAIDRLIKIHAKLIKEGYKHHIKGYLWRIKRYFKKFRKLHSKNGKWRIWQQQYDWKSKRNNLSIYDM